MAALTKGGMAGRSVSSTGRMLRPSDRLHELTNDGDRETLQAKTDVNSYYIAWYYFLLYEWPHD